jgi:ribosomal protein L16 Arg81 hydroxylase
MRLVRDYSAFQAFVRPDRRPADHSEFPIAGNNKFAPLANTTGPWKYHSMPSGSGPPRSFGLARLLSPVSPDQFLQDCWETRHLFVSRAASDYFADLPGLDAVDELITVTTPGATRSSDDGRLVRREDGGAPRQRGFRTSADGIPDIHDIYRAYHDGHTVILNRLHRRSAAVAALCEELEADLHHPVGANMYLTPAHSQGFAPHVDTHDVFVLQLHGSKEWHIGKATGELPLAYAPPEPTSLVDYERTVLQPGDTLYLPRGVPHEAITSTSSSLHLTVGVHVHRWIDLLQETLGALATERTSLRKALPPGFLDRHIADGVMRDVITEATAALLDRDRVQRAKFGLAKRPTEATIGQPGHFRSIDMINELTDESLVMRHAGSICRVRTHADESRIDFSGNYVAGPAIMGPALQFIAEHEQFIVKDVPGDLSPDDKRDLVSRLISEGLLHLSARNATRRNGHA